MAVTALAVTATVIHELGVSQRSQGAWIAHC
jgi:hypothetical protein